MIIPADHFAPARGLGNAHLQTIFASFRRPPALPLRRRRLELPDGDFLDVDSASPRHPARGAPWTLVLHGLEGSSESPYMGGIAARLVGCGIEAALLNYRGCSGEMNRLARSYHSGETGDIREAIAQLGAERAGRPFAVVGFSIGANLLMKLLGEYGDGAPSTLAASVAISPPFDLEACARWLDGPRGLLYRIYLLRKLRAKALAKISLFPRIADPFRIRTAFTFAAYDDAFTAPVHGFASAVEYWRRCSGQSFIPSISRDLLVITADDDPFFPPGYVPRELVAENPRVRVELVPRGGHVGFVAGSPFAPRFWAEERAADHVARALAARA